MLYDLLHNVNQSSLSSPENSSVLKSLLVSDSQVYRSPQKPDHSHKQSIVKDTLDSSEEELLDYTSFYDIDGANDKKTDPDYRPSVKMKRNEKSENKSASKKSARKNSGAKKVEKSSKLSGNADPVTVSSTNSYVGQPYSASSILLSMIKDAGAKVKSEVSSTASSNAKQCSIGESVIHLKTEGEQHSKEFVQCDVIQKQECSNQTAKGILRNLLQNKGGGNEEDGSSNVRDSSSELQGVSINPKQLPFSKVLQNMAQAYSSGATASDPICLNYSGEDKSKKKGCTESFKQALESKEAEEVKIENHVKKEQLDDSNKERNQSLKLVICKKGTNFKVKEEELSPVSNEVENSMSSPRNIDDLSGLSDETNESKQSSIGERSETVGQVLGTINEDQYVKEIVFSSSDSNESENRLEVLLPLVKSSSNSCDDEESDAAASDVEVRHFRNLSSGVDSATSISDTEVA